MRLFFAINLPDAVRRQLAEVQEALRGRVPEKVSWVRPQQLHITLKFLGECEEQQLKRIESHLSTRLFPPPLDIEIPSLMLIPPRGRTRVIAAEVREPTGGLTCMYRTLDDIGAKAGIPAEPERFLPHVTLGRLRPPRRVRQSELDEYASDLWESLKFKADKVELIHSTLSSSGPSYKILRIVTLPV